MARPRTTPRQSSPAADDDTHDRGARREEVDEGEEGEGRALAQQSSDGLRRTRMSRIVAVTGGSSFLGVNLVGLLEEDDRVGRIVAIDAKPHVGAGRKTRSYEVD